MYGDGTGTWINSEFGMIHLLYFTYLTQYFVKQSVHSLFFYNLFSVSPSWCFAFFPFWYCLCHYHSLFLCSWHMFHIYFSYSEAILSYIPVLYTRIRYFHTQEVSYIHIVGYANRHMYMWDVLSTLGISASSEMCEPSSCPCLLYVETYVRFVSIFSSTIQF